MNFDLAHPASKRGAFFEQRPGQAIVEVRGASKIFRTPSGEVHALNAVDLSVRAGSFFTLLGPSGCGKTTLLRMLAGFERPDAGLMLLDGRDLASEPPNKRPVNIVFQSYALFPHLTVAENVSFGLRRLKRSRSEVKTRTAHMLDLVRLQGMADRRPAELSGGQQQRVALARALAPAPKLLLLDEPLSALDRELRQVMQVELKRLQRDSGITFLLVTHDQEEALSLSDEIAVMHNGRVLQSGSPTDIYCRPSCRFVAEFMGANILPGALVGLSVSEAAIRPEAITLKAAGGANECGGHLVEAIFLGSRVRCLVRLEGGAEIFVELTRLPAGLTPGARVTCQMPRDALVPLVALS